MKILNTYSGILQLRTETFTTIMQSSDGLWFAIRLFVIVSLIAACGQWFGWTTVVRQPTLPEQIHQFALVVTDVEKNLAGLLPQTMSANMSNFAQDIVAFATNVEERTINLTPYLGARPSRAVNLFGEWLGTPFSLMADFLVFSLVALMMAKLLGGKGTLQQHLGMTMLAIAPCVLAFVSYIPITSPTMGFALGIFSRTLLMLTGFWATAILLKALIVVHDIELKRAVATLVGTFAVVYLLLPLTGMIVAIYLLFG